MKKKIITIIIIIIAAVVAIQLSRVKKDKAHVIESGKSRVKVEELRMRNVKKTLMYVGEIKGVQEVIVFADVPGILSKKLKSVGETVKKDEPILKIDRDEVALNYSMSDVDSPISGRVLEIFQDVGERIIPAQPVARVGDVRKVEVKVSVPYGEVRDIAAGQSAEIKIDTADDVFMGRVTEVGAALDRVNRKVMIKIEVPNPKGLLRSGMVCDTRIIVNSIKSAKAVQVASVVERGGKEGVFIVRNNIARWVETEILLRGEKHIAVNGNLKEGDKVVVEGNYGLIPDRMVEILK
ncbi:efflux RND transporter periplasmic adaptor subunit [Elusimicrobiota bacterium]